MNVIDQQVIPQVPRPAVTFQHFVSIDKWRIGIASDVEDGLLQWLNNS